MAAGFETRKERGACMDVLATALLAGALLGLLLLRRWACWLGWLVGVACLLGFLCLICVLR